MQFLYLAKKELISCVITILLKTHNYWKGYTINSFSTSEQPIVVLWLLKEYGMAGNNF